MFNKLFKLILLLICMRRSDIKETLKHLRSALADELRQVSFYTKASEIAKKEGMNSASEFFRNAAKDEKKHATEIEGLLHELMD